jgi:hypothetical protein
MQQFCTCGSARGASGNWRPYRDLKFVANWTEKNRQRGESFNARLALFRLFCCKPESRSLCCDSEAR